MRRYSNQPSKMPGQRIDRAEEGKHSFPGRKSSVSMIDSSSSREAYHLYDEIGRGRFGTIYRVYSASADQFYACKTIDKLAVADDDLDRACLETEPTMMALVSPHPNIIRLVDLIDTPESLSIVMELVEPAVTLFDELASSGLFPESMAMIYGGQILEAVAHCHRYGVVHRDVKLENLLLDTRHGTVKLCDFGSASWVGATADESAEGMVGTPYYMAPEVVMGRAYGTKVDVWSIGVILYTMLAGVHPFTGETVEDIFESILRGNLRFPVDSFGSTSPEAKSLLRKMICKDPSRRISADDALRHPWIAKGKEIRPQWKPISCSSST